MAKPLLLLDVDGVLCPFRSGGDIHDDTFDGYVYSEWAKCPWSEANADRVRRLMRSYEIHWCTGWEDEANALLAPLHGWEEFPVVPVLDPGYSDHEKWHWKDTMISVYLEDHPQRPYAFVDDQITPHHVALAELQDTPNLWLPVQHDVGLTDEHVERLEAFADSCKNILRDYQGPES